MHLTRYAALVTWLDNLCACKLCSVASRVTVFRQYSPLPASWCCETAVESSSTCWQFTHSNTLCQIVVFPHLQPYNGDASNADGEHRGPPPVYGVIIWPRCVYTPTFMLQTKRNKLGKNGEVVIFQDWWECLQL